MTLRKKELNYTISLICFCFTIIVSPTVSAAIVQGTLTGTIAEGTPFIQGNGANLFGLDENQLSGQSFLVNFQYDSNLAPLYDSFSSDSETAQTYRSDDVNFNWLSASITVNNITHNVIDNFDSSNFQQLQIADIVSTHPDNIGICCLHDQFNLNILGEIGEPDPNLNSYHQRQFLEFFMDFETDFFDNSSITQSFSGSRSEGLIYPFSFSFYEFNVDPLTNEFTQNRVTFNGDSDSLFIQTTVVPLPATVWLFGSAILGLIGWSNRKAV
jgi:hypothetical protein